MKKILIIEDNDEIRENTAEILEVGGYSVIVAVNGKEGVALAATALPDVILCDIMMPEIDGYEVIKQIKANPQTSAIPFIYLTASGEKKEVQLALDMGASGYVRKPFDVPELMGTIDKVLKFNMGHPSKN